MNEAKEIIDIYTDGACSGNPGPGGWGAILRHNEREKELFGGEPATTNNRMEMTAVIEALRALKRPVAARVHTDSQYVQKGISEWMHGWKRRGWKTAGKEPVKNEDLWRDARYVWPPAPGRMAVGQGPRRPCRKRAGRRAGPPRHRIEAEDG